MKEQTCITCLNKYPERAFRQRSKGQCVWCEWASPEKRARARFKDKKREDRKREAKGISFAIRLEISESEFVDWYLSQPDACHYCGLELKHLRQLQLKRGAFGYYVSWDIDRKDSYKPYQKGNLALSCFMCNMAKGSYFSEAEAKIIGGAIRAILEPKLSTVAQSWLTPQSSRTAQKRAAP